MENSSLLSASIVLWAALAWSAAGGVILLVALHRIRARVGRVRFGRRTSTWPQRAFTVAVAGATAAVILHWRDLPGVLALAALMGAWALYMFSPSAHDAVLGERGVQRGWRARSFAELEEWRLTGEHLRWRLGEEWFASPAPRGWHAELRAQLESACAERESRFKS
jgi:hypothetical protein